MKIIQFGTGNFLRAFIDWMVERMNERCALQASIQMVQSTASHSGDLINAAHGHYHVLLRGLADGKPVEEMTEITCVEGCINANAQWMDLRKAFRDPDLACVFSNTTEAGIVYEPEPLPETCPHTFPAKLAASLYERFRAGLPGIAIFPGELIERNGATLLAYVLRHAKDWLYPEEFSSWLKTECDFCDTLVDRIVPGAPKDPKEATAIAEKFGVTDPLLVCAEPFHFFAIQAAERVRKLLPFELANLNVAFVPDITPYRDRKVRLLNGSHTGSAAIALLSGITEVGQMTTDPLFLPFLRRLMYQEILPTVRLPDAEKRSFADAVLERFANPFVHHRLADISLNSISKWRVRDLPALQDAVKASQGNPPPLLTLSLAALIALYADNTSPDLAGRAAIQLRDDPAALEFFKSCASEHPGDAFGLVHDVLANEALWGQALTENFLPGFAYRVGVDLACIRSFGCRETLERLMDGSC